MKMFVALVASLLLPIYAITAEVREIKIGADLPLSGKLAFIGNAYLRGLQMAVDALNEHPQSKASWHYTLVAEDNRGEVSSGVAAAQKLLDVDHVQVLYTNTTHVSQAVAPLAAQRHTLMIYAATVPTLAEKYETVFRDYFDAEDNARALAREITRSGKRQVGIFSEQSEACELFVSTFKVALPEATKVITTETFTPGDTDFKASLLRLKSKSPDGILFCAWRDTAVLMRQLQQIAPDAPPTYHWVAPFLPANDLPEIRAILEKNHAVSTWYSLPDDALNPEAKKFKEEYQNRFAELPRPDSAYAYDDLMAINQALKSCESLVGGCILDALRNESFHGASGDFSFSSNRVSKRPVYLMQVVNGLWSAAQGKVK